MLKLMIKYCCDIFCTATLQIASHYMRKYSGMEGLLLAVYPVALLEPIQTLISRLGWCANITLHNLLLKIGIFHSQLTMEYLKTTLVIYPFRQSLFSSDFLELPRQSPLLGITGKYTPS